MRRTILILFTILILTPRLGFAAVPSITVADHCTVADSGGGSHSFGPGTYLGICALAAAKDQHALTSYTLDNFSFGLFLASLNGTSPSSTQFWDVSQNGVESQVGLSDLVIAQGDTLSFQLMDWSTNTAVGSPITFTIGALVSSTRPASGGGGLTLHDPFDLSLATGFLWEGQHADGSFGSPLLDDWSAIASAGGRSGDLRAKLSAYETAHTQALTSTTDYERHAMALEALNIDPYTGTPVDTITPIVHAFDGTQIGDASLINDDIFAIFPLLHAGYHASDDLIKQTIAHIISAQHTDGSWDGGVDMTAAAIQALALTPSLPDTSTSIRKAVGYLRSQQTADGGFGNVSSTAWAIQGLVAAKEDTALWSKDHSYATPEYYLATQQQKDGGVGPTSNDTAKRTWETAYAIPAIEHKTWDALLSDFTKPSPVIGPSASIVIATTSSGSIAPTLSITKPTAPFTHVVVPQVVSAPAHELTAATPGSPEPTTTSPSDDFATQAAAAASANLTLLDSLWRTISSFVSGLF